MPTYEYSCCGKEFTEVTSVSGRDSVKCPWCERRAKRLVSAPALLVTCDGFEENNRKARSADVLHDARMANKRAVERDWHKVESGEAEYRPGKAPEAYQPRQHLERSQKRLH